MLVIIDPLIAYMDSGTDLHKATDTMRFMIQLDMLAREFDLAMVVVRHFRKSDADDPLYRGLGSIAIAARVRSALFLGRHPDDPEVRAVAQSKCSYAPEGATILFKLEPANGHPKVHWLGITAELKADDLLTHLPSTRGRPDSEREKAKKLLHEFLEDGPMPKIKHRASRSGPFH